MTIDDTSVLQEGAGSEGPWIGVDFDGTLATYEGWRAQGEALGEPIPAMVARVRYWLAEGRYAIKIMTARASRSAPKRERDIGLIQRWCARHIGIIPDVVAEKDFAMVALYDDRAVAVDPNTGRAFGYSVYDTLDPLTFDDEVRLCI